VATKDKGIEARRLGRAAHSLERVASFALETLSVTWSDRLRPAFEDELQRLQNRADKITNPDEVEYLVEERAVIQQTEEIIRALFAVGIYHAFEQNFVFFFYRWAMHVLNKSTTSGPQLYDVVKRMNEAWSINLKDFTSWDAIDELRLIANCIKHGEGDACKRLRATRPDWFAANSEQAASSSDCSRATSSCKPGRRPLLSAPRLPLTAVGLKIPDWYVGQAIETVRQFLAELKTSCAAGEQR
jgi:hypothetical protein